MKDCQITNFDRKSSNFHEQKKRLEKEGIVFSDEAKLDLKKFQWKKRPKKEKAISGKPQMFR